MNRPLLYCIPIDKIAMVIQKLDDYQKEHYNERFKMSDIPTENIIIHAPDYEEMEEIKVDKEMRKRPKPRKVK